MYKQILRDLNRVCLKSHLFTGRKSSSLVFHLTFCLSSQWKKHQSFAMHLMKTDNIVATVIMTTSGAVNDNIVGIMASLKLFNSLRPSNAYMCHRPIPSLVQLMACRLFSTEKPLFEPMLPYCQLDPKEYISVKFYSKFKSSHSQKCIWKCHLENGDHFV